MSQYRHDRFARLYVKALYKTKGNVRENIPVRRDEDLAIDLLFVADTQSPAWQTEDLGWFDKLMAVHPTVNCSQNTLRQWAAQPDPELGEGVYRLPPATLLG